MTRKNPDDSPKRRKRAQAIPEGLPDPRATENVPRQLVADLHGGTNENTPLAQAQAILQQAYQDTEKQRVKLAKKALDHCPDCGLFAGAVITPLGRSETADGAAPGVRRAKT